MIEESISRSRQYAENFRKNESYNRFAEIGTREDLKRVNLQKAFTGLLDQNKKWGEEKSPTTESLKVSPLPLAPRCGSLDSVDPNVHILFSVPLELGVIPGRE